MSQARVMIVDHDSSFASELCSMLEPMGCDVIEFCDTSEMTLQSISSENPDVVLMGVYLGEDVDGAALAEDVRQTLNVPVISVAASPDDLSAAQEGAQENSAVLIRPVQEWELLVHLAVALHRHPMESDLHKLFQEGSNGIVTLRFDEGLKNFIVETINPVAMKLDGVEDDITGQIMATYLLHSVCDDLEGQCCFGLIESVYRVWKTGEPESYTMTLGGDDSVALRRRYFVYRTSKNDVTFVFQNITTEQKQLEYGSLQS